MLYQIINFWYLEGLKISLFLLIKRLSPNAFPALFIILSNSFLFNFDLNKAKILLQRKEWVHNESKPIRQKDLRKMQNH